MTPRSHGVGQVRVELSEWQRCGPRDDARLSTVEFKTGPEHSALEGLRRMVDIRPLREGVEINTTSFVGRVEVGPLDLVIRPKVPAMPLAQLLRYAYGLRDLSIRDATQATLDQRGFHDLLIAMLLSEVRQLLDQGLSRRYIHVEEQLASPRGQLLVAALSRHGGVTQAKLDCRHWQRSADWLLNQVLKAGLSVAARMTSDRDLHREAHELTDRFDGVRALPHLLARDLDSAERGLTRLTESSAAALTLIRLLRDMLGFDFDGEDSPSPVPGFLFDMNRFFQALLSRFLREHLLDASIEDEHRIRHILAYAGDANPRRRSAPRPRPDYALLREGQVQGFLDAKYRDIWSVGLPETWIYQLSMYALASPPGHASIILYPCLESDACDERIEVRQPLAASNNRLATVTTRPVPLLQLATLLQSNGFAAISARRRLAQQLVTFR